MSLAAAGVSYGAFHILVWPGGGFIGLILWTLSIVMVGLVIKTFLDNRRSNVLPDMIRTQIQTMFDNKQYKEVIEMTATQPDYLSAIIHAALAEAPRGYPAMERAMQETAEDRTTKMLRALEWLNLLGNIGPMIGLLGTVYGMILAFFKIVEKGGVPNPADLAEALGIKLVCTFIGLLIAIPSLSVYGIMRGKVDALCSESLNIAAELIATFRPGPKKEG